MEAEKVQPGVLRSHTDVTRRDNVPLVDGHQLKKSDQGRKKVVKVIATVMFSVKLGILQ